MRSATVLSGRGGCMEARFELAGWLVVVLLAATGLSCRCGAVSPARDLVVQTSAARSCEALLAISSGPAPEVDFGKGAKGAVQRKDKKLGLAFVATSDTPFQAPVRFIWSSM